MAGGEDIGDGPDLSFFDDIRFLFCGYLATPVAALPVICFEIYRYLTVLNLMFRVEDPRVAELCNRTSEPAPYQV